MRKTIGFKRETKMEREIIPRRKFTVEQKQEIARLWVSKQLKDSPERRTHIIDPATGEEINKLQVKGWANTEAQRAKQRASRDIPKIDMASFVEALTEAVTANVINRLKNL